MATFAYGSPKYSVVIPVYNRPEELRELLESLATQTFTDFDVLVVEDGSTKRSETIFEEFARRLRIQYLSKPNTGPGPSRNFGFQHAQGDYLCALTVTALYLRTISAMSSGS